MEKLLLASRYREEIPTFFHQNKLSIPVVIYPTGSGKSCGLPPGLLLYKQKSNPNYRFQQIIVAVPTILAATSLASYVQKLFPQFTVGYAAERQVKYKYNTQIVYATYGHVFNLVASWNQGQSNRNLHRGRKCLILDEFHTHSTLSDTVFAMYMRYYKQKRLKKEINCELIICSATLTNLPEIGARHYRYYPKDYLDYQQDKLPASVDFIRKYPINIMYDGMTESTQPIKKIKIRLSRVENILTRGAYMPNKQLLTLTSLDTVLVFVPGKREIDELVSSLKLNSSMDWDVYPLHAELLSEEVKQIMSGKQTRSRIIVATNVAESSITIPRVTYIFDTMIERCARQSSAGGLRLDMVDISKQSARQRAGRGGRVCPTTVIRMCDEDDFDRLDPEREIELLRAPVADLVIGLLAYNIEPEILFSDRIIKQRLSETRKQLTRLELIDKQDKVTPRGINVNAHGLGVECGMLIELLRENDDLNYTTLLIVILIYCFGPYFRRWKKYADPPKIGGSNPIESYVQIWYDLLECDDSKSYFKYMKENKLIARKWIEVQRLLNHYIYRFKLKSNEFEDYETAIKRMRFPFVFTFSFELYKYDYLGDYQPLIEPTPSKNMNLTTTLFKESINDLISLNESSTEEREKKLKSLPLLAQMHYVKIMHGIINDQAVDNRLKLDNQQLDRWEFVSGQTLLVLQTRSIADGLELATLWFTFDTNELRDFVNTDPRCVNSTNVEINEIREKLTPAVISDSKSVSDTESEIELDTDSEEEEEKEEVSKIVKVETEAELINFYCHLDLEYNYGFPGEVCDASVAFEGTVINHFHQTKLIRRWLNNLPKNTTIYGMGNHYPELHKLLPTMYPRLSFVKLNMRKVKLSTLISRKDDPSLAILIYDDTPTVGKIGQLWEAYFNHRHCMVWMSMHNYNRRNLDEIMRVPSGKLDINPDTSIECPSGVWINSTPEDTNELIDPIVLREKLEKQIPAYYRNLTQELSDKLLSEFDTN